MKKILITLASLFALVAFADEAATTTNNAPTNTESKTEVKTDAKKEAKADKNGHKKMKRSKKVEATTETK